MAIREKIIGAANAVLDAKNRRKQKKVAPKYNAALAGQRDLDHLANNPDVVAKGAKSGRTHKVVEKSVADMEAIGGVDKAVATKAANISRKADDVINLGKPLVIGGYVPSSTTQKMFRRLGSFHDGHNKAKGE